MGMKHSLYLLRGINASSLYLLWNEDVLQPQYIIDEALFYFVVNCLIRDCILNP